MSTEKPERKKRGRWFWFGAFLVGLAGMATLIALFYGEEDLRGWLSWKFEKRKLVTRGVELDWKKFVPPPVPDDQNFAMTPFLAPVLDFNPLPLLPGQSRWRDEPGHTRASSFNPFSSFYPGSYRRLENGPPNWFPKPVDLAHVSNRLQGKKDFPSNSVSRTEAATILISELQPYQPVLNELREAAKRPSSRFNIAYDADEPASILLPHLSVIKGVSSVLTVEGSAYLALERGDRAFDDVSLILFLSDSIRSEPFLISFLVRNAIRVRSLNIIAEGLSQHQWSPVQLQAFEQKLNDVSTVSELQVVLSVERAAFGVASFEYLRSHRSAISGWLGGPDDEESWAKFGPIGWLYLEQTAYHRKFDEIFAGTYDAAKREIHPARDIPDNLQYDRLSAIMHHGFMARMLLPQLLQSLKQCAIAETGVIETRIACALERYRLANNNLPEKLSDLVPTFLPSIPHDVINGGSMKYRRVDNLNFLLYSVGWNEKDDGGTSDDWVWPSYAKQ